MARNLDPSNLTTGAGAQEDTDPVVTSELPTNKVARPGDKMSGGLWISPDTPQTSLKVTGTDSPAVSVAGVAGGLSLSIPASTGGVAIQSTAGAGAHIMQLAATADGKVLEAVSANEPVVDATTTNNVAIKATAAGAFAAVWGLGQPGLSGQGIDAGTGVVGVGGNLDGVGVSATGDGVGPGLMAQGGAGGGVGVQAAGGAAGGFGVYAQSSAASAAMYAEAQGTGAGIQALSVDGPGVLATGGNNRPAAELVGGADAPAIQAWAGGYGPTVVAWSGTQGLTNHSSTFQAGSSTSALVLNASASTVDGFYVGWKVTIGAGADSLIENDYRYIISYNGTSQVAVVEPPFSAAPSNGDSYTVRVPTPAAVVALGQRGGTGAHLLAGYETHRSTVANNVPPSASSFELASGSATDSYYVGWTVSIDSQVTRVTGYVGATKVLTVSPALGIAPGVGVDVMLITGQSALSLTGASAHDGVNAQVAYNGIGMQVTAELPVYLSNPGGTRGHLHLAPSTIGLPASASAGQMWTANDAAKDLYYRDASGWLNLSSLARRVEHFSGHLGFIKDFTGTWNNGLYAVSGANVDYNSIAFDAVNKRAFQYHICTALNGGLSDITVGWEIAIPYGFQSWTSLVLRFRSALGTGESWRVGMLDTDGNAVALTGDAGTISDTNLQTATVTVDNGTFTGGGMAIVSLKISPNALTNVRFYGLTINYRA